MQLLRAHKDDVGECLAHDPKGRMLPTFLEAISEQLTREQAGLVEETQCIWRNIEHIKQIVAQQQPYSQVSGALENLTLHDLVEDALGMASTALARHKIEVVREFNAVPPVLADRHKVLQILFNLISNAKDALDHRPEGRRLIPRVARGESNRLRVEVADNGVG